MNINKTPKLIRFFMAKEIIFKWLIMKLKKSIIN